MVKWMVNNLVVMLIMAIVTDIVANGDENMSICSKSPKNNIISFENLSTLYLPYSYSPTTKYGFDEDAAEMISYDAKNKILYSVGNTNIHVIDISEVTNPTVLFRTSYSNVDITSVEVCGDHVFVAADNETVREHGFVDVFRTYNKVTGTLDMLHQIIVGAVPDMIQPTSDCLKIVVAVEAEPYEDDSQKVMVDPPGSITIINFQTTPEGNYTIKRLGFEQFNDNVTELEAQGVLHVYRENDNPFSNDVEPEYITLNAQETRAYVSLQENNAIAVVDMVNGTILDIHGLGFKDWRTLYSDVSDKDTGINMQQWPVFGMYQPDAIHVYTHKGEDYIITANEGDSKDYKYFSEENRVEDLQLSDNFEPNATRRDELLNKHMLGRLKVTKGKGRNSTTGKYDALYAFGGRGFSIFKASTMQMTYDSGDDIGRNIANHMSELFNMDYEEGELASTSMDKRSDNKGVETESIAIAKFDYMTFLMIGNERPGIISVYSIDERMDTIQPKFETLLCGITRTNDTWENLLEQRAISMVDPEDMRFVPAVDSPNGKPLLIVSGSVSGTINILQINVNLTSNASAKISSIYFLNLICYTIIFSSL